MRGLVVGLLPAWFICFSCTADFSAAAPPRDISNVHQRVVGGKIVQSERDEQEALFNYYFRNHSLTYETRLASLKSEASVPDWRIPYSADIHPEGAGGLGDVTGGRAAVQGRYGSRRIESGMSGGSSVLSLYDLAFNGGENLANSYEIRRIMGTDRALFPRLRMRVASEGWEGYCSGFTASTIRHPEPVRPVDAGRIGGTPGVVFQPSDIKALLTGIYNRTTDDSYLYLAPPSGTGGGPNMGTFHLALANYIGQADHPIGIDRTRGEEAWNNPIYAYKVSSIRDAGTRDGVQYKDVSTTVTYSSYGSDAQGQTDPRTGARTGNRKQSATFRYLLALDSEGRIVGGRLSGGAVHFLWISLYAVQGREDGAVPGNPYIDVRRVIALARASALPEVQKQYDQATIGPLIDPALAKQ
ncbi:MAG TPA: hypothetical protein VMY42_24740 [Thermoguttaceae bacterium]|nr:hypothetical protein [Thermoguttaceae bacterium]